MICLCTARSKSALLLASLMIGVGLGCSAPSNNPTKKQHVKLQGAGASFPAPIYNKWFKAYNAAHPEVQIDYQSVGSGQGVKSVIDKTVDFGASDAAMSAEEAGKVDVGVVQLPMTAGSIVLAYNLEGVDKLQLSREAYASIFLGKITKWNDPAIAKANPDIKLPETNINVVVRADSSGTTFVFTKHLSAINEEFNKSPGTNKMPNWPVGTKSKGNEGVSHAISTTPGSIGYIEYSFAIGAKLKMAKLENKASKYIEATIASAQAALASAEMPDDLIAWIPDPTGDASYPIVTYTWIMCYKKYSDENKAKNLKDVIGYCLTDGQKESESLGYVPLPEAVVKKTQAALGAIGAGGDVAKK